MRTAIVTGASRGLGLALARGLADRGWALVLDARGGDALHRAAAELRRQTTVVAIAGDVRDAGHRRALVTAAVDISEDVGDGTAGDGTAGIDAVVNNASLLGPSPQPALAGYPLDVLREVYEVNVFGPLALVQEALPHLQPGARIVNVTSDAAVEGYEGWGGYGSSKAALEQLTNVLGAEHPFLRVYRVDPGDLRTQMHQAAFPGEDISDRPLPEVAVPGVLTLLEGDLPSGRYRAQELTPAVSA
jgi:NAD(P)-dependent dehydrogenase (short-subunit alcohol dehydrogenase family)